ncbi:U2 snRNP complex subunit [Saccharomycopsis crataegensis]|uniref:U2 snRNP complex subunit n=1 Tax=Saccharomycopsis crataegensis TaxID=43959 RepID=A0AAV5QHH8_9ASCO|nr:U2 snRNP complex subunit [Saccharomycopsis crataegensis]
MAFDSLYLYHRTLQEPSFSVTSALGQFQGKKSQEIAIAKAASIELWKVNSSTGKLSRIVSQDAFGSIRALNAFRLAGSSKDYLAITSDSGKFTVLEYNINTKKFQIVFNEPFFKTGLRRLAPGQYMSQDAKGRAIMLSAIEKNKLVYVFNRDSSDNLTISSPLEANRNRILTFASCGLDVGYENPVFASIEIDYGQFEFNGIDPDSPPKKTLTFYELDLGLNHVVKKQSQQIPHTSNFLLSVPGGKNGPSGVIIACQNFIQYKSPYTQKAFIVPIPARTTQTNRDFSSNYIICGTVHTMKDKFFILLQSNFGDIFKVTINYDSNMVVESMQIKYFDTISICNSMLILKSGFLFADAQHGNKSLYQFVKLGDDDNERIYDSADYFNTSEEVEDVVFTPKDSENLEVTDIIESLNPILDSKLIKLSEQTSRISTVCGTSNNSALKVLTHGLNVEEVVTSELGNTATGVFTTKMTSNDDVDKYLVISFASHSLVLSIGESVEEVTDSGFDVETATIGVQQMGIKSLMQIHSNGIIHLKNNEEEGTQKVNEWFPPAGIKIISCTSTNYQLAVGLSNRELVYFELSDEEQLIEYQERKEMPGQILSLSLGDIPEGKLRSNFLAVSCNNQTLRVLSVDPKNVLGLVTVQSLSSNASSVLLLLMAESIEEEYKSYQLYMHLGLENGIYVKTLINSSNGKISDRIVQYLGPYPIRLSKIKTNFGESSVLICSKESTRIGFISKTTGFKSLPIAYDSSLSYGASFQSEEYPNGLVGVHDDQLYILSLEDFTKEFKIDVLPLRFTPKKFIYYKNLDGNSAYYIAETDGNTVLSAEQNNEQMIYPRETGSWASCLQVINSMDGELIHNIDFENNETLFNLASVTFKTTGLTYLVISTAVDFSFTTKSSSPRFYLKCYKILQDLKLELMHQTKVEKPVASVVDFAGKLLVGMGNTLRLYDMGQKQLLRKAEITLNNLNNIISLKTQGFRIYVGDIKESITFVVYKPKQNIFIPFVDDFVSRHVTSFTTLDYDTVIGGDKFGNVWALRCPEESSTLADEESAGVFVSTQDSYLNGSPKRLNQLCHYYINDIPTSFMKNHDASGLNESVIYTGLQGTIGLLVPLLTQSEIRFFQELQKQLTEQPELMLVGRDHLMYRSYYAPVKGIIDGDLCEKFGSLKQSQKNQIAINMNQSAKEIEKKIVDMRLKFSI